MQKEAILTPAWEVQTTVGSEADAGKIARALLEQRLAACVQIHGPIRSLYWWEGKIQDEVEWKLVVKTRAEARDACWEAIRRLHPYQVPELYAQPWPVMAEEYHQWLLSQVVIPAFHLRLTGAANPLSLSFEELSARLATWPKLQMELDGSFVWRGPDRETPDRSWQVDGMIYDRAGVIEYVELKGSCPAAAWQRLCAACEGASGEGLRVQNMKTGEWLKSEEFMRCLN